MENKWYKKSYRRSLVDMHIEDCDESFLSEFSPEKYVEYLKAAKMDSAMIYLQSHVGLCHYPTKSGVVHKNLRGREDVIKKTIDLIHKNGMFAVGYYSLIYNTREEDRHPEWRMIDDTKTGTSPHQRGGRYGFLCPNNMEHRAFVKTQLSELAEYFDLDGLFLDMTFWPAICKCECCRARFESETGYAEIPDMNDFASEAALTFRKIRYKWMTDFATDITAHARAVMPGVTVSHNNASAVSRDGKRGVDETIGDLCDYVTGDLYGTLLGHSFSMKYYRAVSNNQPYEYMLTRFSQNLSQHTLSKTARALTQSVLLTAAHHGANFVIDAIDPVGTVNPEVAKLIGEAYSKEMLYEKYLNVGESVSDVGLWYSISGRFSKREQKLDSLTASTNLGETFGKNHILYDVVTNKTAESMKRYKVVFAPAIAGLDKEHIEAAKNYVKGGGVLCFSGTEETELIREFFGSELIGMTDNNNTYVAPTSLGDDILSPFTKKYPLALADKAPLVTAPRENVRVLATLTLPYRDPENPARFASIHSNPPVIATEHPMMMEADYGLGKVMWLGVSFDGYEARQHREVAIKILRRYFGEEEQTVTSNAPKMVEIVAYKAEDEWQISLCNVGDADDGRIILPFDVTVKTEKEPKGVFVLPEMTPVDFTYNDGMLTFKTKNLDLFDMYSVKL
ncbi:MAG: alpha-L-fucosidase [Clostridia bacterium]|nr:alpha-L-fucosidase [Clostridia bacterium]